MQAVKSLVVASTNPGKAREIATVLSTLHDWKVESLPEGIPDIEETGSTFIENAILKAEHYSNLVDGLCVADDSGLIVDALGGRPGIYSARYAPTDDARNQRLLEELEGIPPDKRDSRFVCALAVARVWHSIWSVEERVEGQIAPALAGEYGFGYDPLFWVPDFGMTTGQLKPEIKNQISHRGVALRRLQEYLEVYLEAHE